MGCVRYCDSRNFDVIWIIYCKCDKLHNREVTVRVNNKQQVQAARINTVCLVNESWGRFITFEPFKQFVNHFDELESKFPYNACETKRISWRLVSITWLIYSVQINTSSFILRQKIIRRRPASLKDKPQIKVIKQNWSRYQHWSKCFFPLYLSLLSPSIRQLIILSKYLTVMVLGSLWHALTLWT